MKHVNEPLSTFIFGMAAGAAVMYVMDPNIGRRRRAILRDKAIHTFNAAEHTLEHRARDMRNRALGTMADFRGRMNENHVDDEVLTARVRSELGHVSTHPRAISVTADNGCVTLSGNVMRKEMDQLCEAVSHVRGVQEVCNRMTPHGGAESIPELQGRGRVADEYL